MKNILIVGAGIAGKSLAKDLRKHGYKISGFIDDEGKNDIDLLGSLADVNKVIGEHKITDVYFSIPTASAKTVRDFIESIDSHEVHVSIIPRSFKIIAEEEVSLNDLKDVDILHMIGRQPVKQDLLQAKVGIRGKKVLITGAAGSIGSELVKQVLLLEPYEITCIDFSESGIFYLQHDIGSSDKVKYFVANIRDKTRMDQIFAESRPEFVFHAAAYKHVPLMQTNSVEALNNNVFGSLNLIDLAMKYKVSSFVNVSTDKAVNPVNVMGTTKRIVEILLKERSTVQSNTKISSVRFGNVLESNGSVVQVFKRQINAGGPVTVTHKDITRFFMTKEEAAQLIIQSGILSHSGEIFVLDMGEPIKIMDLAKMMVKISAKEIKIQEIGLRPGEKMYEELYFQMENVIKTKHKQIFIVNEEENGNYKYFEERIQELIGKSLKYELSNNEVITQLINLGFKIKK